MKSQNLALWTKNEIHIFDEICTQNGQLIAKKIVKFFHIHWHYKLTNEYKYVSLQIKFLD